nr:thioesterase family protein [Kyrpidia tusciae]
MADVGLSDSVFIVKGNTVYPTELARGPWDPNAQHGGAPAGLFAQLIERAAEPQRVVRLTVELLRPVPLCPLTYHVTGAAGRSVSRWTASLSAGDREVARAYALTGRIDPEGVILPRADEGEPNDQLPFPENGPAFRIPGMPEQRSFYCTAMEARLVTGSVTEPGPAAVWFRLRHPLTNGEPLTPMGRAAASADFGNGISWVLPFDQYVYTNADLTVSLFRMPMGEWIGVDARTRIDLPGIGVTSTKLYDRQGLVGFAHQTLVVRRR